MLDPEAWISVGPLAGPRTLAWLAGWYMREDVSGEVLFRLEEAMRYHQL